MLARIPVDSAAGTPGRHKRRRRGDGRARLARTVGLLVYERRRADEDQFSLVADKAWPAPITCSWTRAVSALHGAGRPR